MPFWLCSCHLKWSSFWCAGTVKPISRMLLPSKDLTLHVSHAQAAMMNWGKQSAFDMFSNLMTFQALASQQGQAQGAPADHAAMPVAPAAGAGTHLALTFTHEYFYMQRTSGITACGALQ